MMSSCFCVEQAHQPWRSHHAGDRVSEGEGIDYTPEAARKIVKAEQTAGTYFMDKKKWERWIDNSAESID
ncbi:MAG: hypothetical protein ACLTQI_09520 [Slackia sp.]